MDDKNKRDARDRNQVAGNEDYEIDYLVKKHGVSRDQVKAAIQEVGNDREKLEQHLKANTR